MSFRSSQDVVERTKSCIIIRYWIYFSAVCDNSLTEPYRLLGPHAHVKLKVITWVNRFVVS